MGWYDAPSAPCPHLLLIFCLEVTYIGAKNQISEKIEEKLEERGVDIDEIEQEIHTACGYLASLTMEVMGQQFTGARETMVSFCL